MIQRKINPREIDMMMRRTAANLKRGDTAYQGDLVCGFVRAATGCDGIITNLRNSATRPQALKEVKSMLKSGGLSSGL